MKKKITFGENKQINFPTNETDAIVAIRKITEYYDLPEFSEIGYEVYKFIHPLTNELVWGTPQVYIKK